MAITREKKEAVVQQLAQDLGRVKLAVLADYRGLTVKEMEELRANLRAAGIDFRVTKNTLFQLAVKQSPNLQAIDPTVFTGPLALAIGYDDEVAPAQLVFQYSKDHSALEIVGAITAEGKLLGADEVNALAKLPSREQLTGQLVGTLAAPLSGLANVLAANLRQLTYVINSIKESKE